MSKSRMVGGLVLLVAVSVAVAKERVYKTPQEVFAAAQQAGKKKDWKTLCGTLTNDSLDQAAATMVFVSAMMKGFAKFVPEDQRKEFLAKLEPVNKVLAKHGITEAALKKLGKEKPADKGPEAMQVYLKRLVAPVKDRCAFFAEMMKALEKMDDKKGKSGFLMRGNAQLKDVKIEDNKARGIIVTKMGDQEKREPIEFRKVKGSWKIQLPLKLGKGGKASPPPASR